MWPISTRVNKPENDDPSILEPIELTPSAGYFLPEAAYRSNRTATAKGLHPCLG